MKILIKLSVLSLLIWSCGDVKIYERDLPKRFNSSKELFEYLEKEVVSSNNLDSLNSKYNNQALMDSLSGCFGSLLHTVDFFNKNNSKHIYVSAGFRDCSGYYFSSSRNELFKLKDKLDSIKSRGELSNTSITFINSNWIGFNKGSEVPLDVLIKNNF